MAAGAWVVMGWAETEGWVAAVVEAVAAEAAGWAAPAAGWVAAAAAALGKMVERCTFRSEASLRTGWRP